MQPRRMSQCRNGIRHFLHRSRNGDNLLYVLSNTLSVIIPIQNRPNIKVRSRIILEPLFQILLHDRSFGLKYLHRNHSLRHWFSYRPFGNNKLTRQFPRSYHRFSKERCQPLSTRNRGRFRSAILFQRFTHILALCNIFKHIFIRQLARFGINDIQPSLPDTRHFVIYLLQTLAFQKRLKHLLLKDLDHLQLATTFNLKSFQLRQTPVMVKHRISFLQFSAFFSGRR
mmetsp:Transcript_61588/g.98103  ORF Transcript_61588/g.98103 Transcript_61588/m.98103 type:complete len:227 (+) Transcript_61588:522-1202(+)